MESTLKKKEKPSYNLLQNCFWMIGRAWRHQKSVLGLVILSAALTLATSLLGLFITPTLLNAIQQRLPINQLIIIIAGFTASLMLVHALVNYIDTNKLFGRVAIRGTIINVITDKGLVTAYPNIENQEIQKKEDRAQMATNSNSQATEAIWEQLTNFLTNSSGFIVYLLLLATVNPVIIAFVLLTTVPGFFLNVYLYGWGYRHREEEASYSQQMNYLINQSKDHTLAKDIRIFGMKDWMEEVYRNTFSLYKSFIAHRESIYVWTDITNLLLTLARNGLAYWFLVNMALHNDLSAAQFLLYFTAVGGFATWLTGILWSVTELHRQSLELSTVREYLAIEEPFLFENGKSLEPSLTSSYEITLNHVSFTYPGAEKKILENINLTIHAGEKLAVVGLNGAGKTTLIKLICGFYDPTEGEILLNGENIKQYNRRDIYRHFSAVFQNFSGLAATIAENIAQSNENIDNEKIRYVTERAGLMQKIQSLPQGFDSYLGREVYEEGVELSGGEMQRLMLARALYKDAPIIILDEPTAALDPIAENEMYRKYDELTQGRTSIYISHRLASTRFCDRVILVSDNRILEEGTHEELLAKAGKYAALFEIQSRYYQDNLQENEEEIAERLRECRSIEVENG